MKDIDYLKNRTVIFLDVNGIQHYGVVKKACRISIGSVKNKNTGKRVKRSTVKGYVIHQTFKAIGLNGHHKEHRVPESWVKAVVFRGKEFTVEEFIGRRK